VAALGCDIAQGYLFSRPIEADAVRAVMAESVVSEIIRPGALARPQGDTDELLAPAS
jgi:hypothetical protein